MKEFLLKCLRWLYDDIYGYDEIIPGLYLGNYQSSYKQNLEKNKIDIVINANKDLPFYSDKTKNIRIDIDDDLSMSSIIRMVYYLKHILPFINHQLRNKKRILIHCYAGMQRSAVIVAGYLIKYRNYNIDEAIEYIRGKRPIAFRPGVNFLHSLEMI